MDIHEILIQAYKEVDKAKLPDNLQETAFKKAIDLISGNNPLKEAISASRHSAPNSGNSTVPQLIAERLELDFKTVTYVYEVEDNDLKLIIPSSKIHKTKRVGAQQIALILSAGRQAAKLDSEGTDIGVIRKECAQYDRYDSPNFSSALKQIKDKLRPKKQGNKTLLKVTRPGEEYVASLINELVGDLVSK